MNPQVLIEDVSKRLTLNRRLNLGLVILAGTAGGAAGILLLKSKLVPEWLAYLIIIFTNILLLLGLYHLRKLFRPASSMEAAKLIDHQLGSKERFLTLATAGLGTQGAQLKLVEDQITGIEGSFSARRAVPFSLERLPRFCAWSLPFSLLLLGSILSLPQPAGSRALGGAQAASAADALREILEETPQINEAVRDQVSDLADALEQGSLNEEQLLEEIDSAILKLEELPLEEAEQLETETLPQSGGANSVATNNDPNQPRSARNSSSRQTYSAIGSLSSATEPPTGERQPAEPQSTKSEKERESKTLEAQAGPSSEATAEQLQKSEQGGSQANQEQGAGSSAKGGEDGAAGKKESEDGKGEKGLKKEDDPKKSTVGLGDGKQGNQGKEGELDAKSEPQAGQSQTGKDGAAENIDQGNSPAGAKQDEKGKDKQEQQGNGKKEGAGEKKGEEGKQGQQKGEGNKKGEGKEQQGGAQQGEERLKEELAKIKEKLGEEQQQKDGAQPGKGKEGKPEQPSGKSGQNQTEKNDSQQKDAAQKDAAQKDTAQKDSEQKKSEQSDSGKAGAPSDKGREGDKKPTDGGKNSSNEQTGSNELGNPKSPRDLTATPSPLGEKKDPFAGKGDAGGEGVNIEGLDRTAVKIPLEDQISVRALGREGKELYKNSKDAKARTALSEQELRKPEAEVGGENQRIPLEYRDLLN